MMEVCSINACHDRFVGTSCSRPSYVLVRIAGVAFRNLTARNVVTAPSPQLTTMRSRQAQCLPFSAFEIGSMLTIQFVQMFGGPATSEATTLNEVVCSRQTISVFQTDAGHGEDAVT